jgi:acetyl esterase/lipase
MGNGFFDSDKIDVEKIRAVLKKAYAGHKPEEGVTAQLTNLGGVEAAIFSPESPNENGIVYYVHGGGLVTGDRLTAGPYASQLALATGCRVVTCSYRLAPEDPFPAGFDDAYAVYEDLIKKYPQSKIALIGESGGAYLALAIAVKARDENIQQPSAVVINSVVADASGKLIRHDSKEETTVSVMGMNALAKMYAPNHELTNPYVSLIYADLRNLPPLKIIYDKGEVLAVDSRQIAENAKAAGVPAAVTEYRGCFHAFTTTGNGTPESKKELAASASFIQKTF